MCGRTCDECVAASQQVLPVPQSPGTSCLVAVYRVPRADMHVEDTQLNFEVNRVVAGVR